MGFLFLECQITPNLRGEKMNSLKIYREQILMSKAELARKAGLAAGTIDRIEKGKSSRIETKRKIILALGLELSGKQRIFGNED